eukprot:GILK01007876.1.p2 GENE.GILK01007876.1~~GILK01007876.1.p2  ORF type:complete len:147 (-),score=31.23 GILK01007876.1:158-598(-)
MVTSIINGSTTMAPNTTMVTSIINASTTMAPNTTAAPAQAQVALKASSTFTVYAAFYTDAARSAFITDVNDGKVPGAASATVVTDAPKKKDDDGNKTGIIVGVIIGVVALIAIIVGVVIYRRRSGGDGEYETVDRPAVPGKERAFV